MSLAQHVTEYEGYDREDPRVDDNASGVPPWATPQLHAIHRVLSYDAFPPLEREVTLKEEYGGITQYNVSLYKRIGTFFVLSPDFFCFRFSSIMFRWGWVYSNSLPPQRKDVLIARSVVRLLDH